MSTLRPFSLATRGPAGAAPTLHVNGLALLIWCALPPLCINAAAVLQPWVEPVQLFRDPLLVAAQKFPYMVGAALTDEALDAMEGMFWLGAASNLGVLVWAATAGAILVALAVVLLRGDAARRWRSQLLVALSLTALLALDDVFQIHEQRELVGPLKGEWMLFPLFAVLFALYAGHARRAGAGANLLLGAAVVCFALSVLADQLLPQNASTVLIEDVNKLFGIFFWAGHHVAASLAAVVDATNGPDARGEAQRSPR